MGAFQVKAALKWSRASEIKSISLLAKYVAQNQKNTDNSQHWTLTIQRSSVKYTFVLLI